MRKVETHVAVGVAGKVDRPQSATDGKFRPVVNPVIDLEPLKSQKETASGLQTTADF